MRTAFATDLHRYRLNGRSHYSNTIEAAIPGQLEPLVSSLMGLNDFPQYKKPIARPQLSSGDGTHVVTAGDLAVIYNLSPLFRKGLNGAGQKIAIVGESAINLQDIRDFRMISGLPPSEPKVILVNSEPGFNDSEGEALLDVEYAGAGAPGATIVYVYASGVVHALQYAIQKNVAPVLSMSFGVCETGSVDDWQGYRELSHSRRLLRE